MVLPLLMSLGLPALAASGSVPFLATLGASVGTAGLAGLGAGLGSFIQTGDLGDGIKTGLTSFIGGKLLGGLTGSGGAADTEMMQTAIPGSAGNLPRPALLQPAISSFWCRSNARRFRELLLHTRHATGCRWCYGAGCFARCIYWADYVRYVPS
jgi:hypothetical protein